MDESTSERSQVQWTWPSQGLDPGPRDLTKCDAADVKSSFKSFKLSNCFRLLFCSVCMSQQQSDWFPDWFSDWFSDWFPDWFSDWFFDWFPDWFFDWFPDWSVELLLDNPCL